MPSPVPIAWPFIYPGILEYVLTILNRFCKGCWSPNEASTPLKTRLGSVVFERTVTFSVIVGPIQFPWDSFVPMPQKLSSSHWIWSLPRGSIVSNEAVVTGSAPPITTGAAPMRFQTR